MRFGFVALSLAGIVAAASSAPPGLKIVARETSPAFIIETTEYIQSDRTRVESRVTPARYHARVEPRAHERDHRSAQIMRCDIQKTILLNYADRTYLTDPVRIYPSRAQTFLASLASANATTPKSPSLLIETTTVQTGERKTAFGHSARRVITTRRHIPLDAAGGPASETEIDGWYIDLEARPSCERPLAVSVHFVARWVKEPSGAERSSEFRTVTFKDIGAPERGYAIETTTTSRSAATYADDISSERTSVTHKVVTQLSRQPLDPALFEIPPGFRAAQGHLAAVAAQLTQAWQTMKDLVAALFQ
jgi:hypothetical protein